MLVGLAVLMAGCRSEHESAPGAAGDGALAPPSATAPPPGQGEGDQTAPELPLPKDEASVRPEPEEQKPERDLGDELQRAVGSPTTCLQDFRASQKTTISIYLTATVRPTGMVIDPSASGSGVSAAAARCIQQLAGAVRLQPLDTEASKRVSTTLLVDFEPGDVVVDPEPVQEIPRNVVLSEPKKPTIPPSGQRIDGPEGQPIDGPQGRPIDGPQGKPIEGPQGIPIEQDGVQGY